MDLWSSSANNAIGGSLVARDWLVLSLERISSSLLDFGILRYHVFHLRWMLCEVDFKVAISTHNFQC